MSESLCALCCQTPPTFICFCAEILLCSKCLSAHLLASPTATHKPVPVTSYEQFALSSPISQRALHYREVLTKELARLHDFLPYALQQIQGVRHSWEEQIAKVTDDYARVISDEVYKLTAQVEFCLQQLDDPKASEESPMLRRLLALGTDEELLSLNLSVRQVNVVGLFKQVLSFRVTCEGQRSDQRLLYKFFGGTNVVSAFDPQNESNAFLLPTSFKFLHNSCWSVTDTGSVLITGGSQTGKSRNDVVLFQPVQSSLHNVDPMQVARRSHTSVCVGLQCYVFGGILEEESLSLCEVYSLRERRWSALQHMTERRSYLGCCQYGQNIYICGGGETASMEVYSPGLATFQLIPLETEVWDNVSMLAVEDAVVIFHGNFQGEVSRFDPNSGSLRKEGQMCYGNSWSSCAPVRRGDVVYCLRSDSIFKYNLSSNTSSYVVRLAKGLKRREYE